MTEQNEQPMDEFMDDPLAEPDDALAQLTAERDELRDKWMRALADAENSRKRADKDRRDAIATKALTEVREDLDAHLEEIPAILDRAFADHCPQTHAKEIEKRRP